MQMSFLTLRIGSGLTTAAGVSLDVSSVGGFSAGLWVSGCLFLVLFVCRGLSVWLVNMARKWRPIWMVVSVLLIMGL